MRWVRRRGRKRGGKGQGGKGMWLEGVIRDSLDQKGKSVWRVQANRADEKVWNDRIIYPTLTPAPSLAMGYILNRGVHRVLFHTIMKTKILL
jgi:hypothetical protein